MLNQKIPANKELQDADKALRRAALKAKQEAERLGTPYIISQPYEQALKMNQPQHRK